MPIVTVKVKDSEVTRHYFEEIDVRLRSPDFFQNPFKGCAKIFTRRGTLLAVVSIDPLYPPVYWASLLFLIPVFIWGVWWPFIPCLLFFSLAFFWSRSFYLLMIWRGLRRKDYDGMVKPLRLSTAWGWLLGAD
jgi:hypothetical protein